MCICLVELWDFLFGKKEHKKGTLFPNVNILQVPDVVQDVVQG